jgi:RNA polymerase sigma factor (sigma-70 family)
MNVHTSYKNLDKTPDLEREINLQIEKLSRRLQVFRPDLVHLKVTLDHVNERQGFSITADLRLPSGDMAARESAPTASAAIKSGFDQLIEQLAKHKDHLRAQWKWPRRRRVGRTRPQPQVPFEETLAAVQAPKISEQDINGYIDANMDRLFRFVERELQYRENSGALQRDQVAPEEVIDEAVANALGDSIERPERISLEPWLYRLAIRAIDEVAHRNRENVVSVPLDHASRPDHNEQVGADENQLQFHHPDEAMTNRDLIADERTATPEASAYSDEMITMVEAVLLQASPEDREAFLLFAVEGFTPDEISAISDRPVEHVRKSVVSAREFLRRALPVPDEFKDKLLQHAKIA